MDRRDFIIKGASFLTASLFGLNGLSKVFASGGDCGPTSFNPRIALIIDDIGYHLPPAKRFLSLKAPITYSILPHLPRSRELAAAIHGEGHEIMLHQPMEPFNREIDPGPGALYVKYGSQKIAGIMEKNIAEIPFALGMNNHMGSRFTTRRNCVFEALKIVKEKNLFFVDSVTSSRSAAYQTARDLRMTAAFRNVFLDTWLDPSRIRAQLHKLKWHAWRYGTAIGIGHPFPETARAVEGFIRALKHTDISLVHISKVLNG
ncbi:MAG: divergent polysaccharide deacetylase family protein [Deltaproteobacteria bacterium]|nr:divergent polysaccharide deacetylase family protein [Deltaproteobacteria bacterium]